MAQTKINVTETAAASIVSRLPSQEEQNATSNDAMEAKFNNVESYIAAKAIKGFKKADSALAEAVAALSATVSMAILRREVLNLPVDEETATLAINRTLAHMALAGYTVYRNGKEPTVDGKSGKLLSDSDDAVSAIVEAAKEDANKGMALAVAYVKDFKTTTGKMGKKGPNKHRKLTSTLDSLVSLAIGISGEVMEDSEVRKILGEMVNKAKLAEKDIEAWNNFIFGRYDTRTFSGLEKALDAKIAKATNDAIDAKAATATEGQEGDATGNGNAASQTTGNEGTTATKTPLEFLVSEFPSMDDNRFNAFVKAFDLFSNEPSGVIAELVKYLPIFGKLEGINLMAFLNFLTVEQTNRINAEKAKDQAAREAAKSEPVDVEFSEVKEGEVSNLPAISNAA